jgi:hypothetical protein
MIIQFLKNVVPAQACKLSVTPSWDFKDDRTYHRSDYLSREIAHFYLQERAATHVIKVARVLFRKIP